MTRPSTTLILAMTADGKIADRLQSPARFSSSQDLVHLQKQVAKADGVLFGAGTLRAYGTTMSVSKEELKQERLSLNRPVQPVQIVASASAKFDPNLRFFRQSVPRWLLTTSDGASLWQNTPSPYFDEIIIAEKDNQKYIDWDLALKLVAQMGVSKLAILGGGNLAASLLAENLIDEFWLTLCPVIFGGVDSPTPIEGLGLSAQDAMRLELLSVERVDQEVFLHYRCLNSPADEGNILTPLPPSP